MIRTRDAQECVGCAMLLQYLDNSLTCLSAHGESLLKLSLTMTLTLTKGPEQLLKVRDEERASVNETL